jgi:hypothetical protein
MLMNLEKNEGEYATIISGLDQDNEIYCGMILSLPLLHLLSFEQICNLYFHNF